MKVRGGSRTSDDHLRRLRVAGGAFAVVLIVGTAGYTVMGMSVVDAVYQTVTTVTTVGFRELRPFGTAEQVFTIAVIVVGVGTALYTFTLVVEMIVEGHVGALVWSRRMERNINALHGHVIVCGLGRVGRAIARELVESGRDVVVIDHDDVRLDEFVAASVPDVPIVHGDATLDVVLRAAGIERASSLVAALAADADNLFVTLSGRALCPGLFIVARARQEESVSKLERAGADRVVNPQELGAQRMASFIVRPNVAEFVDVVMHDQARQLRLQEVLVPAESPIAGSTIADLAAQERTGAMVFATRAADGAFVTNPPADAVIVPGVVLIAIGTADNLAGLAALVVAPA